MKSNITSTRGVGYRNNSALADEVSRIEHLPISEIKKRWRTLRRSDPPATLPPTLMRGALAYALQADRHGGLSPDARRRLARIAKRLVSNPRAEVLKGETPPPGARLVREWGGERHQVEIMKDGFAYRGKIYKSLSVIAREITGARWSGPRFFGLKNRRKEKAQ
jgi:hypothetical protein